MLMEGFGREVEVEVENVVYVAVGKEKKARETALKWVFQKLKGMMIRILYVHVPAQMIPTPNGLDAPVYSAREVDVNAFRETERVETLAIFSDCLQMCAKAGVTAEKVYIEGESVADGILEQISQTGIRKLVMGAAADYKYHRKMTTLNSMKARYVSLRAPAFCQIWFVCKGHLIYTREGVDQPYRSFKKKKLSRVSCSELSVDSLPPDFISCSSSQTPSKHHASPTAHMLAVSVGDDLDDQLQGALIDAKRDAFEESERCKKAEEAMEAISKTKTAEKEVARAEKERGDMKSELNNLLEIYAQTSDEVLMLIERKTEECMRKLERVEEEMISAEKLVKLFKKQREKLQIERDNALVLAQELSNQPLPASTSAAVPLCSAISLSDLEEATNSFNSLFKIREGANGTLYRGIFRHTEVAIKVFQPNIVDGLWEREVDVLSRLRHPNLVTLIGACPESRSLIYEYLPNGSLEDRLNCVGNTVPLTWKTRIQIATDLCSVLNFLHSSQPSSTIHGYLHPQAVLLDANFMCKLRNFGSCTVILKNRQLIIETKEAFPYLDPEFFETGELTTKFDVYAFGVILLRLLTRKPALGIVEEVLSAMNNDNFASILDPSAGDWPFVQAKQLTYMALKCCGMIGENRPDLASDVWRTLKPVKLSYGSFSGPLRLEIMRDRPHFAVDGFTFEADGLRGLFESDHDTSPVSLTNL